MHHLQHSLAGNSEHAPAAGLAAYNWGPGNLDKDIAAHGSQWAQFEPRETAAYIPHVLGAMQGGAAGSGGNTTISIASLTIETKATDAHGIAKDIHHELRSVAAAASTGPS